MVCFSPQDGSTQSVRFIEDFMSTEKSVANKTQCGSVVSPLEYVPEAKQCNCLIQETSVVVNQN